MCRLNLDASGATSALPHVIDRYVDTVFGLEVHFLFPNLSAEKRDLLVAIMKVRNSISAVLNGASRKCSAAEKAALDQLAADLQRKFLEFRSQIVASGIKEQLDPVQKRVFQDEFFSITLDKKHSTTLFFSTDAAPQPASGSGGVEQPVAAMRSDASLRRALREAVPPFGRTLREEVLDQRLPMQGQSAQPVIDRGVAFKLPGVTPHLPVAALQLPVAAPQVPVGTQHPAGTPPVPDVTPHRAEQSHQGGKSVLLISSDSGAQDMIGRALQQGGYNFLVAQAGFSGYATAMRERPDLVLVDLSLSLEVSGPDACLDGRGVMNMLSKLPSSRALPFIGLVSNGTSETEARVLALGARACLQKPLDSRQVLDAVQNAWTARPSETDEPTQTTWTVSASV